VLKSKTILLGLNCFYYGLMNLSNFKMPMFGKIGVICSLMNEQQPS